MLQEQACNDQQAKAPDFETFTVQQRRWLCENDSTKFAYVLEERWMQSPVGAEEERRMKRNSHGTLGLYKYGLEYQTFHFSITCECCDLESFTLLPNPMEIFKIHDVVNTKKNNPCKWLKLCLIEYITPSACSSFC